MLHLRNKLLEALEAFSGTEKLRINFGNRFWCIPKFVRASSDELYFEDVESPFSETEVIEVKDLKKALLKIENFYVPKIRVRITKHLYINLWQVKSFEISWDQGFVTLTWKGE